MIFIGSILGGPELKDSLIGVTLRKIILGTERARNGFVVGSCPALNIIFHVAGSISSPGFNEIREGKFSLSNKLLMIEVPITTWQKDERTLIMDVLAALHQSNAIGFHYFENKNMIFPLKEAEELVATVGKNILS